MQKGFLNRIYSQKSTVCQEKYRLEAGQRKSRLIISENLFDDK